MTQKGHPLLHLTTVFVTGTTTALLQGAPQHLLQPDHRIWERSTTAFVKGSTTVCLNGRPQHYLRSQIFHSCAISQKFSLQKSLPPVKRVVRTGPIRAYYCQRLNDAGFHFVQATVD